MTTVYVTYDQVEAMTMGDTVAVLKDGVLQQCDTPRALYDAPVNLIERRIEDGGVAVGETVIPIPGELRSVGGPARATLSPLARGPESLELVPVGVGIPAIVNLVEELGAEA